MILDTELQLKWVLLSQQLCGRKVGKSRVTGMITKITDSFNRAEFFD